MTGQEMRTDALIKALALDARASSRFGLITALMLATLPALALSFVLMLASAGIRPDFVPAFLAGPVPFKLAVTLTLTAFALLAVRRVVRPDDHPRIWLYALPALAIGLGGILFEAVATSSGVDTTNLFTFNFIRNRNTPLACVSLVLLFSLPPFIAALYIMRRGATRSPLMAGAAAGLFAAGVGATVYALHCPNDDALFVTTWYGSAVVLASVAGSLLGRKILNW